MYMTKKMAARRSIAYLAGLHIPGKKGTNHCTCCGPCRLQREVNSDPNHSSIA